MEIVMTLGKKIRKYRVLKGLTQRELGLAVGFSEATADSRVCLKLFALISCVN